MVLDKFYNSNFQFQSFLLKNKLIDNSITFQEAEVLEKWWEFY